MNFVFLFFIGTMWYNVDGKSLINKRILRDFSNEIANVDLEHCALVDFTMKQLGVVNVLAFLDGSWPFSYKQATMLKQLKDRLQDSGFSDSQFFVITPGSISNSIENSLEDDVEKNTWERISPDEAWEISSGLTNFQPLEKIISPDILLIEDKDELGIWKKLKGTHDQILIIDKCGRLAYQVILPWSILHLPYVKAAILSSYKDDPCGTCDFNEKVIEFDGDSTSTDKPEISVNSDSIDMTSQLSIDEETTMSRSEEDNNINNYNDELSLPGLTIIMHAPHYHHNDSDSPKNDYLVLKTNDRDYHGHLDETNDDLQFTIKNNRSNILFDKDEGPGLNGEVVDFWRDENGDSNDDYYLSVTENVDIDNIKNYDSSVINNYSLDPVTNLPEYTVEEEETKSKIIAHYSRLLPWISYALQEKTD